MLLPAKVAGFLNVLSGSFDPPLAFVMGGALLVAVPAVQYVLRTASPARPVCAPAFSLPSAHAVDARLGLGAAIFGAGWGASGVGPGPAVVNLATGRPLVVAFMAAMVAGIAFVGAAERLAPRAPRAAAP